MVRTSVQLIWRPLYSGLTGAAQKRPSPPVPRETRSGLSRLPEREVPATQHLAAPARLALRPEPDLLLSGRQQEQGEPAAVGAAPSRATPGRHLCRAADGRRLPA